MNVGDGFHFALRPSQKKERLNFEKQKVLQNYNDQLRQKKKIIQTQISVFSEFLQKQFSIFLQVFTNWVAQGCVTPY